MVEGVGEKREIDQGESRAKKQGNSCNEEKEKRKLTLLSTVEEGTIFLETVVDLDQVGTSQQLHEHAGGNNGGNTEFHQGSTVGGENGTHPVEGIRRI